MLQLSEIHRNPFACGFVILARFEVAIFSMCQFNCVL